MGPDQVLTVAQMRTAEEALIAAGSSVDALMQVAGQGAAGWVWRVAAHRPVTVLCGPGNNGGDGYVIAETIRARGGTVRVIAASEPKTEAARHARGLYRGEVLGPDADPHGQVLVDCLFGSGLTRALDDGTFALLTRLAAHHPTRIAIDLPSGIDSDRGVPLNDRLPPFGLTLALGAWKHAHFLMPAAAGVGALRLVDIGVQRDPDAPGVIGRPKLGAPAPDAHKYRRGLLGVIGGAMPGAALLACKAAQGAGAGYVKLLRDIGERPSTSSGRAGFEVSTPIAARPELVGGCWAVPPDLVVDPAPLADALFDPRWSALLAGPGLGRDRKARERLDEVMAVEHPLVLDADGLALLTPALLENRRSPLVVTPHEGELAALERAFRLSGDGGKVLRTRRLAERLGAVVVAKGPDSFVAAPDGAAAFAPRASAWLSTAGTGDVLAGIVASRLATGADALQAACEGLWLHAEAARRAGAAFSAGQLAERVTSAYAACL